MTRKTERLRVLDGLGTPDLWSDIARREPRDHRGEFHPTSPGKRLVAAAIALGVAAAGTLVAVRAFSGSEPDRPLTVPGVARVVFSGGGGGEQVDLFSMNPDGSDVRRLTDTPTNESEPAWSPDGARIAFAGPGDASSDVIEVMDADGTDRAEISASTPEGGNPVGSPTWSPDGSEIAYAAYGDGGGIYVVGLDGGRARRLTSAGPPTTHVDSEPEWSPDGASIAFIRWIIGDGQDAPAYEILRVRPDGGEPVLVARFPAPTQGEPDDNGEIRGLSWSPDGTRLAFATQGAVFTVAADGEPSEIVPCEALGCDGETDVFTNSTTWSADGRRIAFTVWVNVEGARADPSIIHVATLTGDRVAVTSTGVGGSFPAWQPVPDEGADPSPPSDDAAPFPAPLIPRATAEIAVEFADSMLFAEGSLWVTKSANDGTGAGWILRIDPATNEVVARIPISGLPGWDSGGAGMAAGDGSIWVFGSGDLPGGGFGAILQRIDASTGRLSDSIPIEGDGTYAYDVAVDETGVWALYAGLDGFTRVRQVDPETGEVGDPIMLDYQWAHWIVPTDDGLLVLEHRTWGEANRAGVFTVIDPETGQVAASAEPELPGTAWGLAAAAESVWTNAGGAGLVPIDPATGEVVGPPVPPLLAVSFEGLAAGEGGIWFVGYNPNSSNERPLTINRLVPGSGVDVSAEIPRRGFAIAAGGGAVWLLTADGVLRIDLQPVPIEPRTDDLGPFVAPKAAAFMQARIEGSGAEGFLTPEGFEAWSSGALRPLYGSADFRYESFAITFVDDLGDGTFEVGVRTFGARLDGEDEWLTEPLFEETLLLGPGRAANGAAQLLLVTGGFPGVDGP